jgi:hypothetical protein
MYHLSANSKRLSSCVDLGAVTLTNISVNTQSCKWSKPLLRGLFNDNSNITQVEARYFQKMEWFDDNIWLHKIVSFSSSGESDWTLILKISEKYQESDEAEWREDEGESEAWATYLCRNQYNQEEAIMKIRMQYVYKNRVIIVRVKGFK